ncbi:uncharacterized protein MYCFIDRAFT_180140 [Pseudocercospora fijiensis CIRAD86]|uniref:Uncharacterized protein n=1 Tax=Pseudocercospora fijiensis (strain CIRAD86) TaxID=383855 RepID=M3AI04_PSEFD|nr:uncharacterized protein MYCFIDRAFT_180140 [Pseudocercospora fijiensis CIRAD86]EME77137.1 hypothetical protein MYCFIDRAFT_180140 [Pseudocercospora fijiensis CIRAD86]
MRYGHAHLQPTLSLVQSIQLVASPVWALSPHHQDSCTMRAFRNILIVGVLSSAIYCLIKDRPLVLLAIVLVIGIAVGAWWMYMVQKISQRYDEWCAAVAKAKSKSNSGRDATLLRLMAAAFGVGIGVSGIIVVAVVLVWVWSWYALACLGWVGVVAAVGSWISYGDELLDFHGRHIGVNQNLSPHIGYES